MKKLLMVAFVFCATTGFAQEKLFKNLFLEFNARRNMEKSKAEIEKILADPANQNNAEAWLWKSRIFAEMYFDSALNAKYPGAGNIALDAFKKYETLDAPYKLVAEAGVGWRPVDLVYVAGFNNGKGFFAKKQWDSALAHFTSAAYMGDVIVKNNIRKNGAAIDTFTTIYAGYSAQNANKPDEAVKYYGKIASIKIGGDDYKEIYNYLLNHYLTKKDDASFYKYLALAKEVYPAGNDWDDYEIDFISKAYSLAKRAEVYDKEDAAGKLTARKYLLFGQMFSEVERSKEDKEGLDSAGLAKYRNKSVDAFQKAYTKDNSLGLAAFNAGVVLYNEYGEYEERLRNGIRQLQDLNNNKPIEKDPKKKPAAEAKFKEQTDAIKKVNLGIDKAKIETGDKAVEWLEKGFVTLKAAKRDKTIAMCLNRTVDYLANLYSDKMNKAKGKDPKVYDAFEAKFKEYDGLHDTFKAEKEKQ